MFELADEVVRVRLMAQSALDESVWQWDGHDWRPMKDTAKSDGKPDLLDDERLDSATAWLRRLDWFTPEPGLWVGDATPHFLRQLAMIWPARPEHSEFLGNPAFQRLFIASRRLKPKLILGSGGSGIDWFTVSTAWEQEGLRLTANGTVAHWSQFEDHRTDADLRRRTLGGGQRSRARAADLRREA